MMFGGLLVIGLVAVLVATWRRFGERVDGVLNPTTDDIFMGGVACWLLAPLAHFFVGVMP